MTKVAVIGTGYVGLIQAVGLAEIGHHVTCIDTDEAKIGRLKKGQSPIFEPGLPEALSTVIGSQAITFTTDLAEGVKDAEIIFIAVGTPSDTDGRADLKYVWTVAKDLVKTPTGAALVVIKSTVPVGTNRELQEFFQKAKLGFTVVSNPEFLREGSALDDFRAPDRVVLGTNRPEVAAQLVALYEPLGAPVLLTTLETAELIKYASNSFLALEISYINSIALLAEKVGADVTQIAAGMRLDARIGKRAFLDAGLGYGGSCFPKDVKALKHFMVAQKSDSGLLEETERINQKMRGHFLALAKKELRSFPGKTIALWGGAFKAGTDDIREAPSLDIIAALHREGAKIRLFDPAASEAIKKVFPFVTIAETPIGAAKGADGLLVITNWAEFTAIDLTELKAAMKKPVVVDGRNLFPPIEMTQAGFTYRSVGR